MYNGLVEKKINIKLSRSSIKYYEMHCTGQVSRRDKSPKCDKNNLAVWNSWQSGGGVHSISGFILLLLAHILFSFCSSPDCFSTNCDNWLSSPVVSSNNSESKFGIDLSLHNNNQPHWYEKTDLLITRFDQNLLYLESTILNTVEINEDKIDLYIFIICIKYVIYIIYMYIWIQILCVLNVSWISVWDWRKLKTS